MDFPLKLNAAQFVSGMDEFKQDVLLLLKNPIRMFFQSMELGNQAPIHSSDVDTLELGIRNTVEQLNGVTVEYLKVVGAQVDLQLKYRDDIVKFEFSVDSLYER